MNENIEGDCRFVLQLLLLGGVWDESAAEAVAMAIQNGAQVFLCDSVGNTALASAVAAASQSLSPDLDEGCLYFPYLQTACLRLVQDGGSSALPRHGHIQLQQEVALPLEQLPLLMTCIRLGWKQLTRELLNLDLPLHPGKEVLLALCRCTHVIFLFPSLHTVLQVGLV
jgi:hypothetical protein